MANDKGLATDPALADEPLEKRRQQPAYWCNAIKEQQKAYEGWHSVVDALMKQLYDGDRLANSSREREMAISWANQEVIKPAVYVNPPVPAVASRYRDRKPLVRHSSEILERAIKATFDIEAYHETLLLVRDDLVDFSRGVPWLRLDENAVGQMTVACDHVDRRDFVHSEGRNWTEVWWVARRIFLDEQEAEERFKAASGDLWKQLEFAKVAEDIDKEDKSGDEKAEIYEVWCKSTGEVYWIAEGLEEYLDYSDPPINLKQFFPCPKPAYGTCEPHTLKPVSHWLYVKDQIEEINELTARISALSESLRLKGFYAAGAEDLSDAIERAIEDLDNRATLLPVPATGLMSGQKVSDAIAWIPIDEVAKTITTCVELRKQLINDIYEITGISDIMRGQSEAQETAAAQNLKAQYGSIRIRKMQNEMVRIAADLAAMCGEIIAENYDLELLRNVSQYDEIMTADERNQKITMLKQQVAKAQADPATMQKAQQNPQAAQEIVQQVQQQIDALMRQITWEQVMQMLQEQRLRPYMIDIETDSTIMPNENENKQRVAEFLTALGSSLQQLSAMVSTRPETADFAGEVLKFAIAPFRAGRALDASIDEMIDKMKAPQSEGPSEEEIKAQAESQKAQMKAQTDMQIAQMKAETDKQVAMAKAQMEAETRKVTEQAQTQSEIAIAQSKAEAERQIKKAEYQSKMAIEEFRHQHQMHQLEFDAQAHKDKMELEWAKIGVQRDMEARNPEGEQAKPVWDKMSEALDRLSKNMTAKKRVVRDVDGSPIGVETVLEEDDETSLQGE